MPRKSRVISLSTRFMFLDTALFCINICSRPDEQLIVGSGLKTVGSGKNPGFGLPVVDPIRAAFCKRAVADIGELLFLSPAVVEREREAGLVSVKLGKFTIGIVIWSISMGLRFAWRAPLLNCGTGVDPALMWWKLEGMLVLRS